MWAHIINQAEQALREEVEAIDQQFSELIDKLSQLLAIRFSQQELPSTPQITIGYVDNIWQMLETTRKLRACTAIFKQK